ncbi:response regulator [Paeniroseomonas aquatica]|uniref:Response regulator n=1 Tax=Paeniroseomonas aquatica TaxID=373043 RepID=A0ABT8A6K8_9PROT|nr:response regulator [Paeniroseomonas aquatica]MDN3565326.1 response regulator [Paeniroseomonas aquatica]
MHTKILVVEDDAIQRDVLTRMLAGHGHAVEAATDGLDALRRLRRDVFDVVVLDYGLPDVDGLAAAQFIAGFAPAAERPRLIGLSATPKRLRDRPGKATGLFDRVLAKPCPPAALLAAVADAGAARPQPRHPVPPGALPFGSHRSLPPIRPDGQPGPQPGPAPAAEAPRVLLVDDDPVARSIAEAALAAQGFVVDTAAEGLEAFEKIGRRRYQVVVLDIMMPGMDGLAAAHLAFDLLSGADRPRLVALTADPEGLRRREAGAPSLFDEVVGKSAELGTLVAAVRASADYGQRRAAPPPLAMADVARLAKLLGRPA